MQGRRPKNVLHVFGYQKSRLKNTISIHWFANAFLAVCSSKHVRLHCCACNRLSNNNLDQLFFVLAQLIVIIIRGRTKKRTQRSQIGQGIFHSHPKVGVVFFEIVELHDESGIHAEMGTFQFDCNLKL